MVDATASLHGLEDAHGPAVRVDDGVGDGVGFVNPTG
jgi:hypothetical protein